MLRLIASRLRPASFRLRMGSLFSRRFVSETSSESDGETILLEGPGRGKKDQRPFIHSFPETFKYIPLTDHIFSFNQMQNIQVGKSIFDVTLDARSRT